MAESTRDQARAARRTLIDMSLRKQRPGSGSQPNMPLRGFDAQWPDLRDVLKGLSWAIAGAVATREYMPERVTVDLDVVVLSRDSKAASERMLNAGYRFVAPLAIGGSTWRSPAGVPVDLIEGNDTWSQEALAAAAEAAGQEDTPILTLPYLVLMKMRAMRPQDTADVSRMLGRADASMIDTVRSVIARLAPDETEDLESLITLGKLEFGTQ